MGPNERSLKFLATALRNVRVGERSEASGHTVCGDSRGRELFHNGRRRFHGCSAVVAEAYTSSVPGDSDNVGSAEVAAVEGEVSHLGSIRGSVASITGWIRST